MKFIELIEVGTEADGATLAVVVVLPKGNAVEALVAEALVVAATKGFGPVVVVVGAPKLKPVAAALLAAVVVLPRIGVKVVVEVVVGAAGAEAEAAPKLNCKVGAVETDGADVAAGVPRLKVKPVVEAVA